MPLFVLFV